MAEYISKDKLKRKKVYYFQTKGGAFPKSELFIKLDDISNIPVTDVIPIPKGATNGDMIKAVFPNVEIEGIGGLEGLQCVAVSIGLGTSYFALDWWNTPYKTENGGSK